MKRYTHCFYSPIIYGQNKTRMISDGDVSPSDTRLNITGSKPPPALGRAPHPTQEELLHRTQLCTYKINGLLHISWTFYSSNWIFPCGLIVNCHHTCTPVAYCQMSIDADGSALIVLLGKGAMNSVASLTARERQGRGFPIICCAESCLFLSRRRFWVWDYLSSSLFRATNNCAILDTPDKQQSASIQHHRQNIWMYS